MSYKRETPGVLWESPYLDTPSVITPDNGWDGEPRFFHPDSSCQPFLWVGAPRGFFNPSTFTAGRFRVPVGQRGVIAWHSYYTNFAVMKISARTLLVRGTDPLTPGIPLHGALTEVYETGEIIGFLPDINLPGLSPKWRNAPMPCYIPIEEGTYSVIMLGNDQADLQIELFGWTWNPVVPPLPPIYSRAQRRARRRWIPDETCKAFFLSASMQAGAVEERRLLEFRVPAHHEAVCQFFYFGDTVSFNFGGEYGYFTQTQKDIPTTYTGSLDAMPMNNSITEVSELGAASAEFRNFIAPIVFPPPRERFYRFEAGKYKYVRHASGTIGMQVGMFGWTYPVRSL